MHHERYILLYLNCVNLKCIFDITRLTAHFPVKPSHLTLVLKIVPKKGAKFLFIFQQILGNAKAITEPARTLLESL